MDNKNESTYQDIGDILSWYAEKSVSASIEDILHARDRLAVLSYRLAELAAISKRNYNGAYFIRKINIARRVQELQKVGMAYNKAEPEAMITHEKFYRAEILREAEAYKDDLLIKQTNQVLSAMMQRISYAKSELQTIKQQN